MEAYLDNSATTRCFPEVTARMAEVMERDYGNPSSLHQKGVEAERYVRQAREFFAENLKVDEKEIYFTSGGTESNNLALIGAAMANNRAGKHLVTTAIEHASVANPMRFLEEQGFLVTYLPVDENGLISLNDLKNALTDGTILVSIMYVNNEIGAAEPVEEAARLIRARNPRILLHVDAIQAYGKYRIYPKKMGIDMLSVSGHKIHGPKGSGFLYVDRRVKLHPILFGGGQQKGMRSGTENVPGIAGLAEAARLCYTDFDGKIEHLYKIKRQFAEGVQKIEGTRVNGLTDRRSAPHIVSVTFQGVKSEVLLHALEERGIYVSAGSACSSNKPAPSHTLQGIGLNKDDLGSTLRFSFAYGTTAEEIEYCLQNLKELLPVLRRYVKR